MDFKIRYLNAIPKLLESKSICKENKKLFREFFEFETRKLKRSNNLRELDNSAYRTLYAYISRLKLVNSWFNNKPWINLTEKEIRKVYDDLEDGIIKRKNGEPYSDTRSFYVKIIKGKPFQMAGKEEVVRKVIEFSIPKKNEVRFIDEKGFKKIVRQSNKNQHSLLLWLAFDIGENINSLLKLKKKDFHRQTRNKEAEYRINLRKEILKRSRRPRSEITNYPETTELLDMFLKDLDKEDLIFNFGYSTAKKVMKRVVERAQVKTIPTENRPTWKDLRSGMACDLLKKGWSTDEVNARLGHRPSSDEIDKYINYLAIDRHKPKKKVQEFELGRLQEELQKQKDNARLQEMRMESLQKQILEIARQKTKEL